MFTVFFLRPCFSCWGNVPRGEGKKQSYVYNLRLFHLSGKTPSCSVLKLILLEFSLCLSFVSLKRTGK